MDSADTAASLQPFATRYKRKGTSIAGKAKSDEPTEHD